MAKAKKAYVCSDCGGSSSKWAGQCPDCGAWNTLQEFKVAASKGSARHAGLAPDSSVRVLGEVEITRGVRWTTVSAELDRVLGGGVVPGSVILLGGDPGIGKSTLLTQYLAKMQAEHRVLYSSGEESVEQIALRAKRLGVETAGLRVMAENRLEAILEATQREKPEILVVDSVQTVYTDALDSVPGGVSQVRECAARLVRYAKQNHCTVVMVGHVTKEGAIAGPRILEHMVDTVLYFEGDTGSSYRLIRAIKNRFGAVNEIGVFAMTEEGLKDVTNPSAMFVRRYGADTPGSVVLATQEGSRPLLVEVQALVDESAISHPRRLCVGLEQNRLAMLLAVVHRHAGLFLNDQDVFANVVGGVRVTETASDLALLLAVVSSLLNQPMGSKLAAFGEIGLTGELRPVQSGEARIKEAAKLGFELVLVPAANAPKKQKNLGIKVIPIRHVQDAISFLKNGE